MEVCRRHYKTGDTIHCEVEVLEAKQSKSKTGQGVLEYPVYHPGTRTIRSRQVEAWQTML